MKDPDRFRRGELKGKSVKGECVVELSSLCWKLLKERGWVWLVAFSSLPRMTFQKIGHSGVAGDSRTQKITPLIKIF